jgi:predicted protein tyrosine phosphatase
MKKLLFICSENKLRSATAETVFSAYENVEAIGAGTNKDAITTISGDLIEWADIIFAMEPVHRNKVTKRYNSLLKNKRFVVLGIPDNYDYMQPTLIKLLKEKVSSLVHLG